MNKRFASIRRVGGSLGAVSALAVATMSPAHAVFAVPAEVAQAGVDAALLGTAVLAVLIGIRAFKWIRRAM